jgi:predicted component of type VI protein secretion system
VRLVVLEGPAEHRTYEIGAPRTVIGRAPDCDVRVHDAQVSRHHAQVLRSGDTFFIEGLQQANPVIVNDRFVTGRRPLVDGDLIIVGGVLFEVDLPPPTEYFGPVENVARANPVAQPSPVAPVAPASPIAPAIPVAPSGPASPVAPATPAPLAERRPSVAPPPRVEERRTPRPPPLPPPPPLEQVRAMANRLAAAGQRMQAHAAAQPDTGHVQATEAPVVDAILAMHEQLGGDDELARLARLLGERTGNQTDMRYLFMLGAEAGALIEWIRVAQRSIDAASHLADLLGAR